MTLLEVNNLKVEFQSHDGIITAVNNIDFKLARGQTLGIVGESGSGKSQSMLALMGLLAKNGRASGAALYRGKNLLTIGTAELNRIRGHYLSMIFQDPMTSLNPYLSVARQMTEILEVHKRMNHRDAKKRAIELLEAVGIPEAAYRIDMYPHELSGGMCQRVMIAMALLCEPEILIADEPTTALDVTVQAQILNLLKDLQHNFGTSIIMITHDLGVVAGLCDQVMVMYGGRVMEYSEVDHIFYQPSHPYTIGLLGALPRLDHDDEQLISIPGNPPNMANMPKGCPFSERCLYVIDRCMTECPQLRPHTQNMHMMRACHQPVEKLPQVAPQSYV